MSIEKLIQEAEQNEVYAQEELARCYYYGIEVNKNEEKFWYWIEKAANNGGTYALVYLSYIYFQQKDEKQVKKYITDSRLKGNPIGNYFKAFYIESHILSGSKEEALCLYEAASRDGHTMAMLVYGKKLLKGEKGIQNIFVGIKWIMRGISSYLSKWKTYNHENNFEDFKSQLYFY